MNRYIVTHSVDYGKIDGVVIYSNGYIIPNNYNHSFSAYAKLIEDARKAFPFLKDEDIECRTVNESTCYKRMPVIHFPLPPNATHPDFINITELDIDIS